MVYAEMITFVCLYFLASITPTYSKLNFYLDSNIILSPCKVSIWRNDLMTLQTATLIVGDKICINQSLVNEFPMTILYFNRTYHEYSVTTKTLSSNPSVVATCRCFSNDNQPTSQRQPLSSLNCSKSYKYPKHFCFNKKFALVTKNSSEYAICSYDIFEDSDFYKSGLYEAFTPSKPLTINEFWVIERNASGHIHYEYKTLRVSEESEGRITLNLGEDMIEVTSHDKNGEYLDEDWVYKDPKIDKFFGGVPFNDVGGFDPNKFGLFQSDRRGNVRDIPEDVLQNGARLWNYSCEKDFFLGYFEAQGFHRFDQPDSGLPGHRLDFKYNVTDVIYEDEKLKLDLKNPTVFHLKLKKADEESIPTTISVLTTDPSSNVLDNFTNKYPDLTLVNGTSDGLFGGEKSTPSGIKVENSTTEQPPHSTPGNRTSEYDGEEPTSNPDNSSDSLFPTWSEIIIIILVIIVLGYFIFKCPSRCKREQELSQETVVYRNVSGYTASESSAIDDLSAKQLIISEDKCLSQ